jgi:hypothetical protein
MINTIAPSLDGKEKFVQVLMYVLMGSYSKKGRIFFGGGGRATPCASLWPYICSNYYFLVHHPVSRDDRHLLAHAIASDFTVTGQYVFSKRTKKRRMLNRVTR